MSQQLFSFIDWEIHYRNHTRNLLSNDTYISNCYLFTEVILSIFTQCLVIGCNCCLSRCSMGKRGNAGYLLNTGLRCYVIVKLAR